MWLYEKYLVFGTLFLPHLERRTESKIEIESEDEDDPDDDLDI